MSSLENRVYKKRPHRKVKSGCTVCKRRKIKCDETRPHCTNCQRYAAECVYPHTSTDPEHSTASMSPPSLTPGPFNSGDFLVATINTGHGDDLAISDLALMHQWSTATCYGFGDSFPGESDPWQKHLPVLAQQYRFLMRGLLATSALHIALGSTDHATKIHHLRTATYHKVLALPEYRQTIADVSKEAAPAVLAFSAILVVHSFATPKSSSGCSLTSGFLEWVVLHRGVKEVSACWQPWIDDSFLSAQMHRRRLTPVDPCVNPNDFQLVGLQGMFESVDAEELEEDVLAYMDALFWLRQAFAHSWDPGSRLGPKYAILFYIERVSQRYMSLLVAQDPIAMVLLAHLCVLIKSVEHFWYFRGFTEQVLAEIASVIGDDYLPWIEWPLQICGVTCEDGFI